MDGTTPDDLDRKLREANLTRKLKLRAENATYLQEHPELVRLLAIYSEKAFNEEPENLMKHAVSFFCQANLKGKIEELLQRPKTYSRADRSVPASASKERPECDDCGFEGEVYV